MKTLLTVLEKIEDKIYVEIKDGKLYYVTTGEEVAGENVLDIWKYKLVDGYYYLSPYTCDGGKMGDCVIGKPSQNCIGWGIVINSCAKYVVSKIGTHDFDTTQLLNIINEYNKVKG